MKKIRCFILCILIILSACLPAYAASFRPYTSLTGATADSLDSETSMVPGDPAFVVTAAGIFSPYVCKASSALPSGTTVIQPALISNTYRWHICGFAGDGAGLTNVNAALLGGHAASYFQPAGSYLLPTGNGSALTGITANQIGLGNVTNVEQLPLSYLNDSDNTLSGGALKVPTDAMVAAYVAAYVAAHGGEGGSGVSTLAACTDVSFGTLSNNQALLYNSSSGKWANSTLGTGAFATIANYVPITRTVNGYALSSNISLSYGDVGAAASSHNHAASAINSGILGMTYGGLGASLSDPGYDGLLFWDNTDNANSFIHLGTGLSYDHSTHTLSSSAAAGSTTFDLIGTGTNTSGATMTVGNTSSLNFTGTGTINASSLNGHADTYFATSSHTHATYLAIANNLSDLNSVSTARTNLGLGSMATQASNNVSITGGSITASVVSGAASGITSLTGLTTALGAQYGGTGVLNNSANTITFSGNYGITITLSGTTSLTLPTSGTVLVSGGALGTPSSGTLTNCTFPTLNQSTTGSAASLSISGQSGLLTFTGITSTNRQKTVRDAADTILELGGSYTPTGTFTSMIFSSPRIMGSSTGYTSIASANSSATNYTATLQAATGTIAYLDSTMTGSSSSMSGYPSGAQPLATILTTLASLSNSAGYLYNNGSGVLSYASISGGVGGSTGSTDNALIRADGTGGSTVQAGTTTLSDAGILNLPSGGKIQINGVDYLSEGTDGTHGVSLNNNTSGWTPQAANAIGAVANVVKISQNSTVYASTLSPSAGQISFTGSTAPRAKTIRDAADTILELGGSYTPTGTWTSMTLVTPALGTPASGTLTNCTGLPIAGLSASTSTALGVGSIELGHASDTTIARVSAGVISVEGATVPTLTSTNAFTGANTIGDTSSNNLQKVILRKPSSLSDHDWQGIAELGTAGENLSRGDIVYKKLNSSAWKWYKYDANGTDKLIMPEGIATADITSGNDGVILTEGMMRDDTWNITASADAAVAVYGSTTAGGVSLTAPSATTEEVVVVGKLVYANTIRTRFGYASVEVK